MAITDREKIPYYEPGSDIDPKISYGSPVNQNIAIYRAMERKQRCVERMDYTLWRIPCAMAALPLLNENNEVIGPMSI